VTTLLATNLLCISTQLNVYAGKTAPESSRVLTAVLESMDERLHTIELGVKLSTHQTKVRLRYSASRASNESRPDNQEFKLALIRAYQSQQRAFTLHAYLAWDFQLDRQCLPDSFDARGILTSQWSCAEVSG